MPESYGNVGPLTITKSLGKDLKEGDVVYLVESKDLIVINRSYSLDHIGKQSLSVDNGDPDFSPGPMLVNQDDEFIVLRATK